MSCRPPRDRNNCSCGEPWLVETKTLRDATIVFGYFCWRCDGRASGITAVPRPE